MEASLWKLWSREAVQDDVRNEGKRRLRLSSTPLELAVRLGEAIRPLLHTDEVDTCA